MTAETVLICDPDPMTQRALQVILRGAGYKVLTTGTATDALNRAEDARPQAVILELELPDLSGIELCRYLRERDQIAILVLCAIDSEKAEIEALGSGADDYLTKPFRPGQLVARLAARLRTTPSALRFELDGLTIDLAARRVTSDSAEIRLTPIEFALLRTLATSRGPVSSHALATTVWGPLDADPAQRLRTHIANLRAKLGEHHRDLIRTEIGVGYRFVRPAHTTRPLSHAPPPAS
jgi:two-component system KDP operon response regulator KdpE